MQLKEAIILAGGQGTRLRSVISEIPKPMAPVNEVPFLAIILENLKSQGIEHVILSVGFKHEVIIDYFGDCFMDMTIDYAIEKEPLGTGGAVSLALSFIQGHEFLLVNGDTLFDVDIKDFYSFHKSVKSKLSIALKPIQQSSRYGIVKIDEENRVTSFEEKQFIEEGLINGGVYISSCDYILSLSLPEKYSWEKDVLEKEVLKGNYTGFISDSYFIDIGIPEDYNRAQLEL